MTLTATHTKLFAAGGVLALAFAYLLLTSLNSTTVYYLTVGEMKAKGAQALGRPMRIAGIVTPGTIVREQGGLKLRFSMQDQSGTLPVSYSGGTVPDIFADQVEVVVEGKLGTDGTFQASTLLAKCPSKFEDGTQAGANG